MRQQGGNICVLTFSAFWWKSTERARTVVLSSSPEANPFHVLSSRLATDLIKANNSYELCDWVRNLWSWTFLYRIFWRARVCWPFLFLCRPYLVFLKDNNSYSNSYELCNGVRNILSWIFFCIKYFGGLECVGHSFSYVAHILYFWKITTATATAMSLVIESVTFDPEFFLYRIFWRDRVYSLCWPFLFLCRPYILYFWEMYGFDPRELP